MNSVLDRVIWNGKRNAVFALLMVILLFSQTISSHVKASEESLPELRVVSERLKPLVYRNPDSDEILGSAANMVKDMLAQSGITHTMEMLPWSRAYYIARNEPNVLIFMIARSPSREEEFIWLHHYFTLNFYLYALDERMTELSDPEMDYTNARIGVIRNDFTHTELTRKGFTNLIAVDDDKSLSQMLMRGRIDFVVSSSFGMAYFELGQLLSSIDTFEATQLPLQGVPIYFALSKDTDPRIVSGLKQTIADMDDLEQYHLPALREQEAKH